MIVDFKYWSLHITFHEMPSYVLTQIIKLVLSSAIEALQQTPLQLPMYLTFSHNTSFTFTSQYSRV